MKWQYRPIIATMRFGNGGTIIDGLVITYKATNTNSPWCRSIKLYQQLTSLISSAFNGTEISLISPNTFTDITSVRIMVT